jgi:hypothetical protein
VEALRVAKWHCHCPRPRRVPVALPLDTIAVLRRLQVPPDATVLTFKCRCGVIEVPARAFGIVLPVSSLPHRRIA